MPRDPHYITGNNQAEYCPVCLRYLKARMVAANHFAAHVRRGELEERGTTTRYTVRSWRIPGGSWFERGFAYPQYLKYRGVSLEQRRDEWLAQLRASQ